VFLSYFIVGERMRSRYYRRMWLMGAGMSISLLLQSCLEEPTVVSPQKEGKDSLISIDIHDNPRYSFVLAHDSLFENWIPLQDGSQPFEGGASLGKFSYDASKIPDTCWVWKMDHDLNSDEDCKFVRDTLTCPSGTYAIQKNEFTNQGRSNFK